MPDRERRVRKRLFSRAIDACRDALLLLLLIMTCTKEIGR
jgi:hypothetical protein